MSSWFRSGRLTSILLLLLNWLLLFAFFTGVALTFETIGHKRKTDELKAEIKDVRYGLFDPEQWVEEVSAILAEKIKSYDFNQLPDEELYRVIKEELKKFTRSFLSGKIPEIATNFILNHSEEVFEEAAISILNLIKKNANTAQLKTAIAEAIKNIGGNAVKSGNREELKKKIARSYGREMSKEELLPVLDERSLAATQELQMLTGGLIALVLLQLIIVFFRWRKTVQRGLLLPAMLSCMGLMALGVFTPMITLQAGIAEFKILFLGEPVVFTDQLLFYQSKSVWDVFMVLIDNTDFFVVVAGVFVILFSFFFPITKFITASMLLMSPSRFGNMSFIRFFTFKSGKWSMADVMVVAIFLSYLGSRGVVESQLARLGDLDKVELLSSKGTHLEAGFIFFAAYCLLSLLYSFLIERYLLTAQFKTVPSIPPFEN